MSNDKELLELAAKAMNCEEFVKYIPESYPNIAGILCKNSYIWNPLIDDGDALRLAVSLHLEIKPYFYFDEQCQEPATVTKSGHGWLSDKVSMFPSYSQSFKQYCPLHATRRAIVRAAAEIGKGME